MIHYPKLIQIILNLTEIEALPKYIRNKSSEIQNLFSAEIPALIGSHDGVIFPGCPQLRGALGGTPLIFRNLFFTKSCPLII